ncbi:MAG: hypothetical protein ACP6IY_22930 [Promethearchaeia archaeon]
MEILKQFFNILRPLFESIFRNKFQTIIDDTEPDEDKEIELTENDRKNIEKQIKEQLLENNKDIYRPKQIEKAIEFLEKNRYAYYRGKNTWRGDGHTYNSTLFYKNKRGNFYRITRKISKGIIYLVNKYPISKKDIPKIKNRQTYCNFAASVFYNYFVHGRLDVSNTLQYHKGKECSANKICKNLKKGLYDFKSEKFEQCSFKGAINNAILGGYSIAVLKNKFGSGHIATFTSDSNIFQAGKNFGKMTLAYGFGKQNLKKLKYYRWVKNV